MNQHAWSPSALGMGWRPSLAPLIAEHPELGFCEIIAENHLNGPLPVAIENLQSQGKTIIPHGVSLSLGSSDTLNIPHLKKLRRLCAQLNAPFLSEHIAFVRSGASSVQSLLPVPRTPKTLGLLCDRAKASSDILGLPLVLENIAQLFTWPDQLLREADWLNALCHHGQVEILLDISNLYANIINGFTEAHPKTNDCVLRAIENFFQSLDLNRVRYLHVAGGAWKGDFYTDTHAHPLDEVHKEVLSLAYRYLGPIPTLLERDHDFTTRPLLEQDLALIESLLSQATHTPWVPTSIQHQPLTPIDNSDLASLHELQERFMRFLLEDGETPYFLSPKDAQRIRDSVQAKHKRFLRYQEREASRRELKAQLKQLSTRLWRWLT